MRVFTYGSNMLSARLRERVPSAQLVCVARLNGHCLRFHKRSVDGSSKADALRTNEDADHVWGVVFEIAENEKESLDRAEGSGYVPREVALKSRDGEDIVATSYFAERGSIVDNVAPYTWYKNFVVTGALEHDLPTDYIAAVQRCEATRDADRAREETNASIARVGMWSSLWTDFRGRANRISGGQKLEIGVDEAISWQLQGNAAQVGKAIPLEELQLPELYSGSPWRAGIPTGPREGHWIAFICGNPSIAATGVHPRLQHLKEHPATALISTFDDRFAIGVRDEPIKHGRPKGPPVHWDGDPPSAVVQDTWRELERLLADALEQAGIEAIGPLGSVAAIADAVPWKFKSWNSVREKTKVSLIRSGARYLHWFLQGGASGGRPPSAIAFLGSCARRTAQLVAPSLPLDEKVERAPFQSLGGLEFLPGVTTTVFAGPHPVDGANRFPKYREEMVAALVAALR